MEPFTKVLKMSVMFLIFLLCIEAIEACKFIFHVKNPNHAKFALLKKLSLAPTYRQKMTHEFKKLSEQLASTFKEISI